MLACKALEGEFDYNTTPLSPLGSLVIAGVTPHNRALHAPFGTKTWLIGPELDHYRYATVFNPNTRWTETADLFYLSETNNYRLPKIIPEEQLTLEESDLVQ